MKIAVIVPTYNEAGAIGNVLEALMSAFQAARRHEWAIIVVDGHSEDNTTDIVRQKIAQHPGIHLIEEQEKRGIASAYVVGIRYAIDTLGADAFIEFDGDGQHDPRDVLSLALCLEEGYDYGIGSRYVEGGSVPQNWAFHRKVLSRFGSLYVRLLLELPVHDATSGLKITRVAGFADKLPLSPGTLLSTKYAYKIQLLQSMVSLGARIQEIPIHFLSREHDVSKSTWRDIFETLKVVTILRLQHLREWRLFRVVLIGGIGFVLQTTVFEFFGIRARLLWPSLAAVLGGELAILSNFFLNERFSFRDRVQRAAALPHRLLRFHVVSSGSIFVQWILIFTVERLTENTLVLRSTFVIGVFLGFIINYAGYYFYVWRKR